VQKPEVRQLLPVAKSSRSPAGIGAEGRGRSRPQSGGEFLFEPDQEQVLGALLPHSLNFQVYQILLEAKASEHSARMVAMKNATDNAKQFIKDLTLEYNKLRQANITKELLEISQRRHGHGVCGYFSAAMTNDPLLTLELPGVKKLKSGKVREVFDLGDSACCSSPPTASPPSIASCPTASRARARC
jgi:hypothetical protein